MSWLKPGMLCRVIGHHDYDKDGFVIAKIGPGGNYGAAVRIMRLSSGPGEIWYGKPIKGDVWRCAAHNSVLVNAHAVQVNEADFMADILDPIEPDDDYMKYVEARKKDLGGNIEKKELETV